MPQRQYFSNYGRGEQQRRINVLPYLLVAVLAALGWLYLHSAPPPLIVERPTAQQTVAATLSGTLSDANSSVPLVGLLVGVRDASVPATGGAATNLPPATIRSTGAITVAGATTNGDPPAVPLSGAAYTATTGTGGSFFFAQLPPNPLLMIGADGYAPLEVDVSGRSTIDVRLVPNVIRGYVLGADKKPLGGALVVSGAAQTQAGADGSYRLRDVAPNANGYDLVVKAAGYRVGRAHLDKAGGQDFALDPFVAKGIYVSADTISNAPRFAALLALADKTEINTLVIDVKKDTDGFVLYDTALPAVKDIGAINPLIPNLQALVQTLHDHNIYVIARLPLFWDEKLAQARPEWAIRSKSSGGLWADAYAHHWTNPRRQEVWSYNLAIAREVAGRGVDEIQFDYVRFPSDGNLADADYGLNDNRTRSQVIAAFLAQAQAELSPLGAFIAADVFGLTPIVKDDVGIGQQFDDIADQVDFICPMAYPSHYADGFLEFPKPAEHPAEVVGYTVKTAQARLVGRRARLRPWLQDFTLHGVVYGPDKVRAEIDACDNQGTLGWLLWNYDNTYTEGALRP